MDQSEGREEEVCPLPCHKHCFWHAGLVWFSDESQHHSHNFHCQGLRNLHTQTGSSSRLTKFRVWLRAIIAFLRSLTECQQICNWQINWFALDQILGCWNKWCVWWAFVKKILFYLLGFVWCKSSSDWGKTLQYPLSNQCVTCEGGLCDKVTQNNVET